MSRYRVSGKTIEGVAASKDIQSLERPGSWTVVREKNAEGVYIQKRLISFKKGASLNFQVDGFSFKAERLERERSGASGASVEDLKAQFPGKVRKILIAAGTTVEAGTPLLLVEAMKMEFQIKAPSKGVVKGVLVTEGQQLQPGQLLVDFVPEGAH